ncbi:hypothetical protein [Saguinine gammaherpesvirus 1]|uniref:Tegument protein G48 n=1 Tax=Saguinine gammaherpesvirus 1 TaxID=2169901 RepID=A0A9Q8QUR0_9GAMA|nr:hypothetical protein [Saguinine gammaherpesvirus 1]
MCSIFNSVPSQRTVVGTMEVSIFIPGLEKDDHVILSKILQNCGEGKGLKKNMIQLKRLFCSNLEAYVLSLLTLKQAHVRSPLFREKKMLISFLQEVRLILNACYNELKDYPPNIETPISVIDKDCKERLSLILSEACGCIQCMAAVSKMSNTDSGRPHKVLTHQKYCPAQSTLNFVYNQMIVGETMVDPEFVLPDLMVKEEAFTNQLYDFRKELSLLTTCFYLVCFYMFMELYLIQDIKELECLILSDRGSIPTASNTSDLWNFVLLHAAPQNDDSGNSFPLSKDIVQLEYSREIAQEINGPIPKAIKREAYSRMASCSCQNKLYSELANERDSSKNKSREFTSQSKKTNLASKSSPKLQRQLSYVSPPRTPDSDEPYSEPEDVDFEITFEDGMTEPNFLPIEEFDRLLHISFPPLSPGIRQMDLTHDEFEDKGDDSSPESPPESPQKSANSL